METWALALLSGLAAALVAVGATLAVERFGGSLGGVLATLPTTIIPATAGFAYRLEPDKLVMACAAVPVGQLVDAFFLLVWRYLPPALPPRWSLYGKLAVVLATSLLVWVILAAAYVGIRSQALSDELSAITIGCGAAAAIAITGALSCINLPPSPPKASNRPPAYMLVARGLMAGLAIFAAVCIATVDDVAGGMASTFPAIFSTVQVSLWISHGQALPHSATGPMVLGSVSVAVYALLYSSLAQRLGPLGGAAATWPLSIALVSLPVAYFLKWRAAVAAAKAGLSVGGVAGASGTGAGMDGSSTAGASIDDRGLELAAEGAYVHPPSPDSAAAGSYAGVAFASNNSSSTGADAMTSSRSLLAHSNRDATLEEAVARQAASKAHQQHDGTGSGTGLGSSTVAFGVRMQPAMNPIIEDDDKVQLPRPVR